MGYNKRRALSRSVEWAWVQTFCPECDSEQVQRRGRQYRCLSCGLAFEELEIDDD